MYMRPSGWSCKISLGGFLQEARDVTYAARACHVGAACDPPRPNISKIWMIIQCCQLKQFGKDLRGIPLDPHQFKDIQNLEKCALLVSSNVLQRSARACMRPTPAKDIQKVDVYVVCACRTS